MKKNAIFWIREDFRIEHNPALSFASQNHDNVVALFIYNKTDFDKKREAQKWWPVSYTHLRAHETCADLVCRLLLEKKKKSL